MPSTRRNKRPNEQAEPPSARPNSIEARVAESLPRDVGRGIVRLDPADLERLGLDVGAFVSLAGNKATACRAMPTFPDQRGQGRAHLDGLVRANAGVGLDDTLTITPLEVAEARRVALTPTTGTIEERDLPYIGSLLDGVAVTTGDTVRATLFGSRAADFVVDTVSPGGAVVICPTTELTITRNAKAATRTPTAPTYEEVGGLGTQLSRIREMIELPLRYPQVFERLGIDPPKGVLLHGPPGTGKTLIARTIAHESDASFFVVSGPEIVHKHYGESEKHLREIWQKAAAAAPAIIFVDEIDSIAPKRENVEGEVEKRIVAQLLALMDGLNQQAGVVVIAATNLPNSIDPALRRPGRFDREIEIAIPDQRGRRQILDIHTRGMPIADDVDLDHIASITHGCVGADLEALCREAAMACLRTIIGDIDFAAARLPYETIQSLEVSMEHFRAGLHEVEPSAIREVFIETPNVSWDDIGGLGNVRQQLIEAVEWPLRHADTFRAAGVQPPKGILLAGPPGIGKTLTAKAVAAQSEANFISIKGPELMSKFVGESERRLREIFRKARQASPCVVFFDEIDALIPTRGLNQSDPVGDRILAQFLAEMDGVEELAGVLVLGATNRVDLLDPAMLRPGRFDEVIRLEQPDAVGRAEIFAVHMRDKPLAEAIDPAELASRTHGASGAEIAGAMRRAAMAAVRRVVRAQHAGEEVPLNITPSDITDALADADINHGAPREQHDEGAAA